MSVLRGRIEIVGRDGAVAAGIAELRQLGPGERMLRALVGLIVFWILAVLFVFVPGLHFVLVPGMFTGGIIVFVRRFGTHTLLQSASGQCPDCGRDQTMEVSGRWKPPVKVLCGACKRDLALRDPTPATSTPANDELAATAAEDDPAQTIADDDPAPADQS